MPLRAYKLFGVLAALALLGACTRSADEVRAEREASESRTTASRTGTAGQPTVVLDADMVTAVSSAASTTPIDLKFRLDGRPEVGKPLQVTIALIPDRSARVARIHLSLQGGDGLRIDSGTSADIEVSESDTVVQRELRLQPLQAGVHALSITTLVDTDSASIARTYSIPVIASEPGG
jgi:hypothetical protein